MDVCNEQQSSTHLKGVLSLLKCPLVYISPSVSTHDKRKRRYDAEQCTCISDDYLPCDFEFTLFYFCDSTCQNSLRFASILSNFIQECNKTDHDLKPVGLICVPNDESSLPTRLYGHFASLSGFWHLGGDYNNRLALIRLLSVTWVPTLIIVNNLNGKIVTDQGLFIIEAANQVQYNEILLAWRTERKGLDYSIGSKLFCSIV